MSFEDLQVWQRAVELSADIYRETKELRDFGFRDQLTRSGLSIPSNIAEGYERDSDAEIAQFLKVAKGSSGEVRTQAIVGKKAGTISDELADRWADESKQLGRMLAALIRRHRQRATSH
ncbi:four helix bundle protein [Roseiconus lacunae]|uniref:four helix bundle protein n=1 Tax=Roseiconus lacunae TaxID=2605694 RepID=UPI003090C85D|nr:four helix bundle protein [Stieleria sp. HD01]